MGSDTHGASKMPRSGTFIEQFRTDIGRLIAEIEGYMRSHTETKNRELLLQREAFEERRNQAERLRERITNHGENQALLLEGDAYRIHESLKLSLDYFRDV